MNLKLTKQQEAFCQAYIRLGDKTAAYREAYNASKMKPETIYSRASKLSNEYKVSIRIDELQKKVADIAEKKFEITATEMLRHLDILRKARIDEYVNFIYEKVETQRTDDNGEIIFVEVPRMIFKPFEELTPQQLMCIESIKQNRYGEIELKLHGKEWTIEKINKHIGFYEKDNEQKQPGVGGSKEEISSRIEELIAKRDKKQ